MNDASLVILTGASRGLGRAMAEPLLQPGSTLLALARQPVPELAALAAQRGATLESWAVDLAEPAPVAARLSAWLVAQRAAAPAPARVRLIHNAALLTAPGPIDALPAAELAAALRVGLEAPMLLTAAFLAATGGPVPWCADRRVLFISSGLGRRAMAGSAPYCAVKGGLDHFARALALDEAAHPGGARVVSLAPGVIDTDMQVQLRGADAARFAEQARFAELHRSGALDSPAMAAAKVLHYLERADFGQQVTADVRDPG